MAKRYSYQLGFELHIWDQRVANSIPFKTKVYGLRRGTTPIVTKGTICDRTNIRGDGMIPRCLDRICSEIFANYLQELPFTIFQPPFLRPLTRKELVFDIVNHRQQISDAIYDVVSAARAQHTAGALADVVEFVRGKCRDLL